jgi:hypothetical protein
MLTIMLDPLKEVKYNRLMKEKAPTDVSASTRAMLTAAEATRTLDTFIIGLSVVELKRRFHDLPFLQDRRR